VNRRVAKNLNISNISNILGGEKWKRESKLSDVRNVAKRFMFARMFGV